MTLSRVATITIWMTTVGMVVIVPGFELLGADEVAAKLATLEPRPAFQFLLAGLRSNQDTFRSGEGTAVWRGECFVGEYLGLKEGEVRTTKVDFAFSNDKLRWDRTFEGTLPNGEPLTSMSPRRQAFDGKREYEYVITEGLSEPSAYIRAGDVARSGALVGETVDIKYLMEPVGMPLRMVDQLLNPPAHSAVRLEVAEVRSDSGGLVQVRLRLVKGPAVFEMALTFDPAQGYNIVREELAQAGQPVQAVNRTLRKRGDGWFLAMMEHSMYVPGTTKVAGTTSVTIADMRPNVTLADSRFTLRGMGLPRNIRIWDMGAGVDYRMNPDKDLDAAIDMILETVHGQDGVSVASSDASSSAARHSETAQSRSVRPIPTTLSQGNWGGTAAALLLGGGVVIVLAVLGVAIVRRKRAKAIDASEAR